MAVINTLKEQAVTSQPLLLATIVFPDGTVRYYSTHNGDSANGGYSYNGNNYLPRIDNQEIERFAAMAQTGVDRIPAVTLRLADPDGLLWTNDERGHGYRGAQLTLTFATFDVITGAYSTDSFVPFLGTCSQPRVDEKYITISATSRLDLSRFMLPSVPISVRCPWANPTTVSARATANTKGSVFYPCGETRSLAAAPPCSYTKETCTQLNRFGGITWEPSKTGSGREYTTGNRASWRNADTSGRYKQYVPLILGGQCWLDAIPVAPIGDGNYTRSECIIGYGEIDVLRVVVNGIELAGSQTTGDYRWHYVNRGTRDGAPNGDVPYNGQGDPYGNMTAIQVLMPRSLWDPSSLPAVRVFARRKTLRAYRNIVSASGSGGGILVTLDGPNEDCAGNPPFTVTIVGNSWSLVNGSSTLTNWTFGPPGTITLSKTGTGSGSGGYLYYEVPAVISTSAGGGATSPWALMEALEWTTFQYDDFDATSWANAAKISNATITYTDRTGTSATQARFSTAMAITSRRSAAEVVRGIRQAIGAMLLPGSDGKLKILLEGTLAEQQPYPVDGSNYDTAVSSKLRSGSAANGYAAYRFTSSNSWGLTREGSQINSTPNRVSFEFQDPSSDYAVSTYGKFDSEDVSRVRQEIPGSLQVQPEGIATYNHAARAAKLGLAKILRGNPSGDTRGTDWYQWTTSFRGCRLQVGQLVLLNDTRLGLTDQLIRIVEVGASRNMETMTLRGHYHSDDWYLDSAGNDADPEYSNKAHDRLARPALPWAPNYTTPFASDSMFAISDKTFELLPVSTVDTAGNPITNIRASGYIPVNSADSAVNTPVIGTQGTTAPTGGSIPGGITVYAVACSRVNSATPSAPSIGICRVDIPPGTNTNTATIPIVTWDPATTDYELYAGTSPLAMTLQTSGTGKPTSITITSLLTRGRGIPDVEFDRIWARVKRSRHSGILGAAVAARTSTSITIGGTWTANSLAGYDVSLLGKADGSQLPIANFRITANTTNGVLTVTPDPSGVVAVGDAVVVRSKPSISGTVITDTMYVNPFSDLGAGLSVNAEKGMVLRVISGRGRGGTYSIMSNTAYTITCDRDLDMDSTSRYIIEYPSWLSSEPTTSIDNSDPSRLLSVEVNISNYRAETLVVLGLAIDGGGAGMETLAPVRDIYVFGTPLGIRVIGSNSTMLLTDATVLVDSTLGPVTFTFLPSAMFKGRRIVVKHWAGANMVTVAAASGETIEASGSAVASIELANLGDVFELVSNG